jgi:hypothetical protein
MRLIRPLLLASLLLSSSAAVVSAQTEGRVAVGASVSRNDSGTLPIPGGSRLAVLWRLGSRDEGWGFRHGFNWYSTELDEAAVRSGLPVGKLRVRPLMAGYGYARRFGRVRVSANMLGGFALNSFSPREATGIASPAAIGADHVTVDVSNSLVLRPEVSTWIDLNGRVGLNITAGYTFTRPTVTTNGPGGIQRQRLHGDVMTVKVGAVYSIF